MQHRTDERAAKASRRFRVRPLYAAATAAVCALTISLGGWQTRRADEKAAIQARLDALATAAPVALPAAPVDAGEFAQRRVVVRGVFDDSRAILLDNKVLRGRPGYQVVAPLRIAGGDRHVLVNRGWIAAGRTRDELPAAPSPAGEQRIEGVAVPAGGVYELAAEAAPGRVWQNLVLDRYAAWSGFALQPLVVLQTGGADDGLAREWPRPDAGVEKHLIYAWQWYSFAALAAGLYVWFGFRRPRPA